MDFFIEQERQIWEMTKIAQTFDHNIKQSFVQTVILQTIPASSTNNSFIIPMF